MKTLFSLAILSLICMSMSPSITSLSDVALAQSSPASGSLDKTPETGTAQQVVIRNKDAPMSRQDALKLMWGRLLSVFVLLLVVCVIVAKYGGELRCSVLVFLTGNIGGYVSVHRSLGALGDGALIELSGSWLAIVVPSLVGGILAFLLYFLFLSKILAGELFPKFEADDNAPHGFESLFAQHAVGMSEYAKVFFWSFIAGFNQTYVVDIINSIQSKS